MKHMLLQSCLIMLLASCSEPAKQDNDVQKANNEEKVVMNSKGRALLLNFLKEHPGSMILKNIQVTNLWCNQFVRPGMPKTVEEDIRGVDAADTLKGSFGSSLLMNVQGSKSKPFLTDSKLGPLVNYDIELSFNKGGKIINIYQSMEFARYDLDGNSVSDTLINNTDTAIDIQKRYFRADLYAKYRVSYNKKSKYPVM